MNRCFHFGSMLLDHWSLKRYVSIRINVLFQPWDKSVVRSKVEGIFNTSSLWGKLHILCKDLHSIQLFTIFIVSIREGNNDYTIWIFSSECFLPSAPGRRLSEEPPDETDGPRTLYTGNMWEPDRWDSRCSPSPPHGPDRSPEQQVEEEGGGCRERERERKHLQTPVRSHHTSACCLCSPRLLVEVVADFLLVDVDDVLHQQVPLEAVDSVAIQHHLVSAGRTAETPAVHEHGGASLEQRRLERKKIYQNINNTMMVLPFEPPRLPVNAKQLEVVVIQHSCMLGFQ